MTTKTVKLEYYIELTYDPNSSHFKESLESFREVVREGADEDDMLINIASSLNRHHDYRNMIEGVGCVRYNGRCANEEVFCGVEVDTDEPDCYASIEYND